MSNHLPAGQPAAQGGGAGSGGGGGAYSHQFGHGHAPVANGSQGHPPAHHSHGRSRGRGGLPNHHYSYQPHYNQANMYNPYMNQQFGHPYGYNAAYPMHPQYGQPNMAYHGGYGYQQPQIPVYNPQPPPQPHFHQSPSMQPFAMNSSSIPLVPSAVAIPPSTAASNHSSHVGPIHTAPPTAQPAEASFDHQLFSDQLGTDFQASESRFDQRLSPDGIPTDVQLAEPPHNQQSYSDQTAPAAQPEEGVFDQQSYSGKPIYGFGAGSEPKLSYPVEPTNGDVTDEVERERHRQEQQINGPLPTPNPTRIFRELPWATNDLGSWPKRKKMKKRKVVPTEGHVQTLAVAADPEVPQNQAPEDNPPVASAVQQTPSPTVPTGIVVPILPKDNPVDAGQPAEVIKETGEKPDGEPEPQAAASEELPEDKPTAPPVLKNWADVARGSAAAQSAAGTQSGADGPAATTDASSRTQLSGTLGGSQPQTKALVEVLRSWSVDAPGNVAFIEPRGLYNSAVDCYINSILQVLLYCPPFYDFLSQVKTQSAFKINNDTPLLEALIGFRDQFKVIKSAATTEELKAKLKREDYQQFGDTYRANSLYDVAFSVPVIKRSKLRLGKQQDAEEFLMLLFDGLQTECARVISQGPNESANRNMDSSLKASDVAADDESEWTTVDSKQKSSVTQQSGLPQISTPLSRIFHGQTRRELRVPGRKASNTDQLFHALGLLIDDPSVKDVSQALHHFNVPETVSMDPGLAASQQFIHTLPRVLVLHLLRFKPLSNNAYQKDGKRVGYPLELDIPPAVLSRQTRNRYSASAAGIPRYRLMAVVYHHGEDMHRGHYSVDVRRQDGESWLRINDTKIEAITSAAVVEMGVDDAAAKPARASKGNDAVESSNNPFAAMGDDAVDSGTWEKVGSTANGNKKYSSVVNGKSSGTSTPKGMPAKNNDNKVAYLLFYQQI